MSTDDEQINRTLIHQLSDQERLVVYNEEKARLDAAALLFSPRSKMFIAVYLCGCLLLYLGIPTLFWDYFRTGEWNFKPETDIFSSLLNAAVELIRPFLAVVVTFWTIALVPMLFLGFYCWFTDGTATIKQWLKK